MPSYCPALLIHNLAFDGLDWRLGLLVQTHAAHAPANVEPIMAHTHTHTRGRVEACTHQPSQSHSYQAHRFTRTAPCVLAWSHTHSCYSLSPNMQDCHGDMELLARKNNGATLTHAASCEQAWRTGPLG
eukprot:scaffold11801_cov23-Tisochrysis_lutea.AAC.6